MLITQGKRGAVEINSTGDHFIPPQDTPYVSDTNGAGDTFATSYMLHLALGAGRDPADAASWAASRAGHYAHVLLESRVCVVKDVMISRSL
eukprot:gene28630-31799_t